MFSEIIFARFSQIFLDRELITNKIVIQKRATIVTLQNKMIFYLTVHVGFEPTIFSVTGRRDKPLLQWTKLRELDLNQRPSGYEPDELPDCSIPRY